MTLGQAHEWQMAVLVVGMVGALVAAVWAMIWGMMSKFTSVYRRIDECKQEVELKFATREVCAVVHRNLDEKVDRIETEIIGVKLDIAEVRTDVKKLLGYANGKSKP